MATAYKTPGVYVEEIPKFPPSIAAVETAIPAFIGYTEKAIRNGESLIKRPMRIESISEYEEIFGGGSPQTMEIYLDSDDAFKGAKKSTGFLLYDSLRLFYANGGGNCYVVSVGDFKATLAKQPFFDGIKKLEIEDEPTILLFPDAANLASSEVHDIQVEALMQCNNLKDRVTLCDLRHTGDFSNDVGALRDGIGINNLKYGAAYGPWINTSLPRFVYHRDLTIKRDSPAGATISLSDLTTDKAIIQILFDTTKAQNAVDSLRDAEPGVAGSGKNWQDELKKMADAYDSSTDITLALLEDELRGVYDLLAKIVAEVKTVVDALPAIVPIPDPASNQTKVFILKSDVDQYIANSQLKKILDLSSLQWVIL
jgi:hypothetical protein